MRGCRAAAAFAALALFAGCGGGSKSPAPPPVAEKPAATAVAAENPPVEAPAPSPAPAQSPAPAAATKPPLQAATTAEPDHTPNTSLPGAIPPAPAAPAEAKPDKPADPLQWLQDQEARQVDYKRRVGEAEANLAVASASVADWEKTILAFKNPFRPRPQLSAEDAAAIEGMDGVARVAWGEGKLAVATAARDTAQKTLDDLKANPPSN